MDKQDYARVLRSIGQDLEELRPEYVEIKQKGKDFIARGRCRASSLDVKTDARSSPLIERLWERMLQRDSKAASPKAQERTVPFVRRYSPHDNDRLDQSKHAHRTGLFATPDIHGLGEMLRTIGRLIDAEGGRLIKLSRDLQTVTFEYRDAQGVRRKKQLSSLQLLQDAAVILHGARDSGFYEQADSLMKKATRMDSNDPRLWFVWGNIERDRQRYDKAGEYMRKALELSPNDAPILGALGEIEKRRGNYEEAEILLLRSMSESKNQWNYIVSLTSLADNLRRWAETVIKDKRIEQGLEKLRQAYDAGKKAVSLTDDFRARSTLGEVCLALGVQLRRHSGFEVARPYLEEAIVREARRARERKNTERACYVMSSALLRQGQINEAKKYYSIGREVLFEGTRLSEAYKELKVEFSQQRLKGKLERVVKAKGYGFLKPDSETTEPVYLSYKNVIPRISIREFDDLEGHEFSFLTQKSQKGPRAKRARLVDVASE
jgi:tetratricopeptide (TPR) repeat protein